MFLLNPIYSSLYRSFLCTTEFSVCFAALYANSFMLSLSLSMGGGYFIVYHLFFFYYYPRNGIYVRLIYVLKHTLTETQKHRVDLSVRLNNDLVLFFNHSCICILFCTQPHQATRSKVTNMNVIQVSALTVGVLLTTNTVSHFTECFLYILLNAWHATPLVFCLGWL